MPGPGRLVLVREAASGADGEAVAALFAEYLGWAADRLAEEFAVDLRPTDPAQILASLPGLRPPGGRLLLAERDQAAIGVGAIRRIGSDVGEIKRMYVRPAERGSGVGAALLDALIDSAAALGVSTLRLDTCRFMHDAHSLYRSRVSSSARRAPSPRFPRTSTSSGSSSSGPADHARRHQRRPAPVQRRNPSPVTTIRGRSTSSGT